MQFVVKMVLLAGPLLAAEAPKEDAAKKDLEKMQGHWALISLEEKGKTATEARRQEWKLSLDGDQYTFTIGDVTAKGVYKLDPTKKPKELDIVVKDGPDKGRTKPAIYEFDADNIKMAVADTGTERPKDFSPNKGYDVEAWKRSKP
jgi:uncharacterized protein (TIGR03067 family)